MSHGESLHSLERPAASGANTKPLPLGPSPKTDRVLRPVLLSLVILAVCMEIFAQLAQKGNLIGDLLEAILILLSLSLWGVTGFVILSLLKDNERLKRVLVLAVCLLLFSQTLSLTDEIQSLDTVPLFGRDSPLNNSVESASQVLGLGLLLISIYFSLLRVNEVRNRLDSDRKELSEEIQRRERIEEELRESEKRYRDLYENANDIIYTIDLKGNFTAVNKTTEEITGYSQSEALQLNIADVVAPDHQERVWKNIGRRVAGEDPEDKYELDILAKDGTRIPVEVSTRLIKSDGRPTGIQGVARDIRERKKSEAELRESEARFRSYFELPLVGIAISSPEKKWLEVNDKMCEILGYSREEMLGLTWAEITHPDDLAGNVELFERTLAGELPHYSLEKRFVRKDGAVVFVRISARPVLSSNNTPQYFVGIFEDITKQKRAEEERLQLEERIQQTQKMESLGVLAGGIAHDFNNLLMGVLGHASVALRALPDTSPAIDSVRQIETAALRAADLAKQMLAYSGKGRFLLQPIDLNELVEEMAHLLEVSISKGAILKYNFALNLPAVEGDITQLRQVIMNLITNASEAIDGKSGVITVCTGATECDEAYLNHSYIQDDLPKGMYVYLEVTDTGCGMSKETVEKIFDPFYTTKFTGRGLGLSALLGIIRGHKGAIRVYSEKGKGTTMKILLPCSGKPAESVNYRETSLIHAQLEGTVLLVDDEETVRIVAKDMLEECGLEVLTACDGREAVDLFRTHQDKIALVLLDMTMPHMDGEETFREIKRMDNEAQIILSSGYNEQEVTDRFAGKGLAGFIQKPYRISALLEKVYDVLKPDRTKEELAGKL